MLGMTPRDHGMIRRSHQFAQQRLRELDHPAQIRIFEIRRFRPGVRTIRGIEELDNQVRAVVAKFEAAFNDVVGVGDVPRKSVQLARRMARSEAAR